MGRRKTPLDPVALNQTAAANCRSILEQLTHVGRVDRKQFIAEMQSRSMEHYGKPLDATQVVLLNKICTAYEREIEI
jgi:hypothetical protein